MNRREAMTVSIYPLLGLGSSPVAVASVREGAPVQAIKDCDDDIFHAVYMFDPGKVDFVVRGIYTNKAEADAHAERLKAAGSTCCGSLRANRAWLQEHFIGERMGAMQDALERLEARLMIDANGR